MEEFTLQQLDLIYIYVIYVYYILSRMKLINMYVDTFMQWKCGEPHCRSLALYFQFVGLFGTCCYCCIVCVSTR